MLTTRIAEYVRAAITRPHVNVVFDLIHGTRAAIITRLNQAVAEIVDKTALRVREVGMHVYVPQSKTFLYRIARDTVRSVSSTPGSDRWRKGEGIVGTCWAENERPFSIFSCRVFKNESANGML